MDKFQLPDWVIQDIQKLSNISCVSDLDISVQNDRCHVNFNFSFRRIASYVERRIRTPEPIILDYSLCAEKTEPHVLSGRNDFPRDLPHLNPVASDNPVSICLWRAGGNKQLYAQRGVEGVIDVLGFWMEDAKRGLLNADGWEPTPTDPFINLITNLSELQEKIITITKPTVIKAKSKFWLSSLNPDLITGVGYLESMLSRDPSVTKPMGRVKPEQVSEVNTFLFWDPVIDAHRSTTVVDTVEGFQNITANQKVFAFLETLAGQKIDMYHNAVMLILAQHRPVPVIKEVHGLSSDPIARRVELSGFLIIRQAKQTGFLIKDVNLQGETSTNLLKSVSGTKNTISKRLGVVGAGALGSTMIDMLAKSGLSDDFTIWDPDLLQPHNNARHIISSSNFTLADAIGPFKAILMADHLNKINRQIKVEVEPRSFYTNKQRSRLGNIDHILDFTGGELEANWLKKTSTSVSRMYITDEGNISILQTQPSSKTVDMLDLEAIIFISAIRKPFIKNWLNSQSELSSRTVGFSCSSATLEMPWYTIQRHAGSMMPSLIEDLNEQKGSVKLHRITDSGSELVTLYSEDEEPFDRFLATDDDGFEWEVSFAKSVLNRIASLRAANLPNETAGFLLGLVNIQERRISIVFASKGDCKSATAYEVCLSSVESDEEVNEILSASNNMLIPMGTWHSHPGRSASQSGKDILALQAISTPSRCFPTVMLIEAETARNVLVAYNRNLSEVLTGDGDV